MLKKINLSNENTYILSISGGVDSMCLLDCFIKQNFRIVVVNFNHQKRSESILDHQMIEQVCLKHNLPYYHYVLNLPKSNFQAKAREQRIKRLKQVADAHHTNYIVTAHHLDDQLETILMRLIRGSNLYGYGGMQESLYSDGYYLIKPFLTVTKASLINYAQTNQVEYLEDQSNASGDYLRNRIRHQVIPILKQEGLSDESIINYTKQLHQAFTFIRQKTKDCLCENQVSFDVFKSLDEVIMTDLIAYFLEQAQVQKSQKRIYEIIKQLNSNKPNLEISLNKHFSIVKDYQNISLVGSQNQGQKASNKTLIISHNEADVTPDYVKLCYNELDFPISIRKRKPGDRLAFPYGHKKLSRLLIDLKIPTKIRDNIDIITSASNIILWIPDLYINECLGNQKTIYLKLKE